MDINAALDNLHSAIDIMSNNIDRNEPIQDWDAEQAIEAFYALNQWLANGGFLPNRWADINDQH